MEYDRGTTPEVSPSELEDNSIFKNWFLIPLSFQK